MAIKLKNGWEKCPSVTKGGKPWFYHHPERKLWVVWDRFNKTWLLRQWQDKYKKAVAISVNGFYHHKTPAAAMKAAEQLK